MMIHFSFPITHPCYQQLLIYYSFYSRPGQRLTVLNLLYSFMQFLENNLHISYFNLNLQLFLIFINSLFQELWLLPFLFIFCLRYLCKLFLLYLSLHSRNIGPFLFKIIIFIFFLKKLKNKIIKIY